MVSAEDRIGSLPNWHVHSLPTMLAVGTSVLSWWRRNLWATTSNLSFSCKEFSSPVKFTSFINFAVLHRDHTVAVRSFSLAINSSDFHFLDASCWICYAANSGLQTLDLRLLRGHLYSSMKKLKARRFKGNLCSAVELCHRRLLCSLSRIFSCLAVEPRYGGLLNLSMCILKASRLAANNIFMQALERLERWL